MNWTKASSVAIKSECGRYSIARVSVYGEARFELWHDKFLLGHYVTADQARAAADQHAATVTA